VGIVLLAGVETARMMDFLKASTNEPNGKKPRKMKK